jgi:hypothetical protein
MFGVQSSAFDIASVLEFVPPPANLSSDETIARFKAEFGDDTGSQFVRPRRMPKARRVLATSRARCRRRRPGK